MKIYFNDILKKIYFNENALMKHSNVNLNVTGIFQQYFFFKFHLKITFKIFLIFSQKNIIKNVCIKTALCFLVS